MRPLILYIATSTDGFIATEQGDTSWLHDPAFEIPGEDFGYTDLLKNCDTTLMGNSTYKAVLGFDMPFPYPNHQNFVFTKTPPTTSAEFVTFITEAPATFVANLKQQPGKSIWLIGGSQINQLLFEANLIDKIILTQVPKTLNNGIPLFTKTGTLSTFKIQEKVSFLNGFEQTTYLR